MISRTELALLLDHSVLKPEATATDVVAGAALVKSRGIGYYCVQPWWVRRAAAELRGSASRIVSVVGFPHGCDCSPAKAKATELAVADGAAEIDMVINVGALKSGESTEVAADIAAVVRAAGETPVKVILETAALTEAEKRLACQLSIDAGAAFVKTSTGFHPSGGATIDDVKLLRAMVGPGLGVKASGGIRSLADTLAMLDAGANRIGTSASAAILDAVASAAP